MRLTFYLISDFLSLSHKRIIINVISPTTLNLTIIKNPPSNKKRGNNYGMQLRIDEKNRKIKVTMTLIR